ncbi:MAG: hypothetical protein C5B49_11320 [Bdellovibrio sp.]|nr:MAG: hypothetical protein C5B49_11320 [Bdellovibrio sp.]
MNIEIHEIRSFIILARKLNYRLASEELAITQPALTKKIKGLEEKIGGPLFHRTRQSVELLPAGRIFLESAQNVLAQFEAAVIKTENALRGEQGLLRIGFGVATITKVLNHVIASYRRKYPKVELTLKDMSSSSQLSALLSGGLDVGFVRLPVKNSSLNVLEVTSDCVALAVPRAPEYRLVRNLADAKDMPFILISPLTSPSLHSQSIDLCRTAGFQPRIIQVTNESFTMLNLTGVGLGVSMVCGSMKTVNVPNVRWLEIERSEWKIGLAWRRTDQSRIVRNFVDLVKGKRGQLQVPEASR